MACTPAPSGPGEPSPIDVVLPAEAGASAVARHRLAAWLRGLEWPEEESEDVVLAVSEAVSNAVEHGYGIRTGGLSGAGPVRLTGRVLDDPDGLRLLLTVEDRGGWRDADGAPGYRGRGLDIMRACAERVTVTGAPTGTVVELRSRPTSPSRPAARGMIDARLRASPDPDPDQETNP